MRTLSTLLATVCLLFACQLPADAATLVDKGQPQAVVVLPAEPTKNEQIAAAELIEHIEAISGAKLTTTTAPASDMAAVWIGRAAPQALEQAILSKGDDPASFALSIGQRDVAIRGLTDQSTIFGVYELLERLGVRWFMPGELGTVKPQMTTVALAPAEIVQVPSFHARFHSGYMGNRKTEYVRWTHRMRHGGLYFPSAHGLPIPPNDRGHRDRNAAKKLFDEHPEYFALINGKRVFRQDCISNPNVIAMTIESCKLYFRKNPDSPWIGMGPNDGYGFCECDNCTALDNGQWDSFHNEPVVTDRYIWFFNQVLKGLDDEFPDKKLCFYAYVTHRTPPTKFKPDPRIVPAIAPIVPCRTHGPGSAVCPEGATYYEPVLEGWSKLVPEVYDRGYWYNLSDIGLPFPMTHRVRKQIPIAKAHGVVGWRVQTDYAWAAFGPSLYVASKLMWDHTADVDALVRDYADKMFGPAAEPMHTYFTMMDDAIANSDHHAGACYDTGEHYPPALRQRGRTLLREAAALAEPADSLYARRVAVFAKEQALLDGFLTMVDSRNHHDFVTSRAAMNDVDRIIEDLAAYDMPMNNARNAREYMQRFFRLATEQGYARTTNGNERVAPLDDDWNFLIDPGRLGDELHYWDPNMTGGSWQRISSSRSWSNQGLHFYKGEAWYRQTVHVDAKWQGKRIFLWSGGVDEKAQVYVNGQSVGISHGSAFVPFEVDATQAVRAGADNVVVIRINNKRVDEIGTGGVIGPVMFYAPAAGDKAELENIRTMGETFP